MVVDVFLRKSTRTFFRDLFRRTFWRNFDEYTNHAVKKHAKFRNHRIQLSKVAFKIWEMFSKMQDFGILAIRGQFGPGLALHGPLAHTQFSEFKTSLQHFWD